MAPAEQEELLLRELRSFLQKEARRKLTLLIEILQCPECRQLGSITAEELPEDLTADLLRIARGPEASQQ
jgi:hypothetical protein